MSARGPWSVKGIDSKAREAALQAARNEGITLGDYLNRLLLESDQNAAEAEARRQQAAPHTAHNDIPDMDRPAPRATSTSSAALDELTRRVEAAEARSRLAITDIDKSVVGLL
ncbi:MAG: Localization factor PodJS, partial [Ponticaulis sp.]|nr:Localization factor PodJS [Ponticaulis sp.]